MVWHFASAAGDIIHKDMITAAYLTHVYMRVAFYP
jgi:hypothetical protein